MNKSATLQLLAGLALMLLSGLANPVQATGFVKDFVILNGTRYYTNSNGGGPEPPLLGISSLGSFDRGTGVLTLGAEANTNETGNDDVQAVQLFYRVYLQGSTPGAFTSLPLTFVEASGPGSRDKKWQNITSNPNLLAATSGPGVYVLELYFQGAYDFKSGGGGTAFIFDNRGGLNYTTTFTVTGSVPVLWTGAVSDDWFNPLNWSPNTIPTSTTDATIAFFAGGAFPYPTIRSQFDNQGNPVAAQVRTLRILGNNGALGARNFLTGGELRVYGDFQDPFGGFGQSGGVFTLAGGTQTFDGAAFTEVHIEGGGTKLLTNRMDVLSRLAFIGQGGVISTRTDNSVVYNIDLGVNATITGETETSFVLGILRAQRFVDAGQTNSFGNIGVDLTTTTASRITLATRLTGYVYNGVPPSKSVKRSFSFTPENPNVTSYTIGFHYLDSEINGIFESDLVLFRSLSGGIPFTPLFRTSIDSINNVLIRTNIEGTLAATFTLGDRRVPLPVTLTSFDAVTSGADALLTWSTAQEINSKGFEIQVSADGVSFQKLGFVASETPNSSAARTYQYRDVAASDHGGTRYYRLRQLDIDGKQSFYGPRVVNFGAVALALVQGYPNPFTSEINLTLQSIAAGPATVRMLDGLGRVVRTWQPKLAVGTGSLQLPGLTALPHGMYVVQVRYPDGQTQRLKLVKD
ncbi:T9SS type A sorting domain-containing protein [Hymenobacter sp. BT770]|uniref:T9SS type A sorting domain-containing protein n=1 Tax=Hymenobacter sp. BT770 TaxID=2886942 RepID=UPI001D11445C|nr:T9SS type A sorting domain-containing protein [Hymenobacter sp. BT770]MCC3151537.1 T9SS type A sorting domain-containing protein [Hymenobacter sp. BT770]MDO3413887.1 T9SS type A sorting domain-containing protein [Hymenobacter sp. BT770]